MPGRDSPLELQGVTPGFGDPVRGSQASFRAIMTAQSRPGLVQELADAPAPPPGLDAAAAAVLLTLADFETPVWLPPELAGGRAAAWLRFHCGCPFVTSPREATFAAARAGDAPPLSAFHPGDAKYPDRSTTLILMCEAFDGGPPLVLTGPGVKGSVRIAPAGLAHDFPAQVEANGAAFQCGVDMLLTCGSRLIGLPRSTRVAATGS